MPVEGHAGLTVSSSKLQLVEIIKRGDQFLLENIDEAFFTESINFESDKDSKISSMFQGAFNDLAIRKSLLSSTVSFTLPFELFYIYQIPYDNTMLHTDLIEEFRFHFSLLYPFSPVKDLAMQYIEADKGNYSEINTAIVIALQRRYLMLLEKFCRQNSLRLKFVDNIHTASERALSVSQPVTEQNLVLSVWFNNKYLSVIYSSFGRMIYFKVIPVTDASEISAYLERETKPGGFLKIEKNQIDAAYLCGEDIPLSVAETLRKVLKLNFIHFNPFVNLLPGPGIFKNRNFTDRANSFSAAAGIAIRTS